MILKGKVSKEHLKLISDSYNDLGKDPYTNIQRYRALSRFNIEVGNIKKLPNLALKQPRSSNSLFGEVARQFGDIERQIISSESFQNIFRNMIKNFQLDNINDYQIWVHQIRTRIGEPIHAKTITPEGIHRDDAEKVGIVCVNRNDLQGAANRFYWNRSKESLFHKCNLDSGDLVIFDDNKMWHDVSQAVPTSSDSYRDTLIFCAINNRHAKDLIA